MQLNPDKNLFSVAPVGAIVIIGRHTALKGGITREYAINLAACLIIAAKSNPVEIRQALADVMSGNPLNIGPKKPVQSVPNVAPQVVAEVAPFIGEIDAEEAASLTELARKQEPKPAPVVLMHQEEQSGRPVMRPTVAPPPKAEVATVDLDAMSKSWGVANG